MKDLERFRLSVYNTFPCRRDANMNLLDAISSHGHQFKSSTGLCESACFDREYSSITDAINGLSKSNYRDQMMKNQYNAANNSDDRVVVIVDATAQPRKYSSCSEDRSIVYQPNQAPGNKPITVGHEYSVLTMLPNEDDAQKKHWLIPLDARRIKSNEKSQEVGMQQISNVIENLSLKHKLVISVADSKYGTEYCRKKVSEYCNWAHIFRFNSTRNIFSQASRGQNTSGNIKRYGDAMKLNDSKTHSKPDKIEQKTIKIRNDRTYQLTIKVWYDQILRGTNQFKGYEHPFTLIQLEATDTDGKSLYKYPLWLGIAGDRRHEIKPLEAFFYYDSRYDIEHFFRFGKRNLLLDKYQTPDVYHEENWWQISILSYNQLYLARNIVPIFPKKWEQYLPKYKSSQEQHKVTATPSQTQRGFYAVLRDIGTPARACKPRGNSQGRSVGDSQKKRIRHPVIFKSNPSKPIKKKTIRGYEKLALNSHPKRMDDLVKSVKLFLNKMNFSPQDFFKLLQVTV